MKGSRGARVLEPGSLPTQEQVARALADVVASAGSHAEALDQLEEWSRSVGYFDHLPRGNLRLAAWDARLRVEMRLQVNYSRLGYKPGERAPGQPANPLAWENVASAWKPLLRAHELRLAGVEYFAHATPFPLCDGHFVVNVRREEPMRMGGAAVREMAAFLSGAPGWLAASNSDVEWAGASVLCHHHFQAFRSLRLPVECASRRLVVEDGGVVASALDWPAPVLLLQGTEASVLERGAALIDAWKCADPGRSTCNLLLRRCGGGLSLHVFLRHPAFRTPRALREVKSEGVGIIEMAGEIIVPPLASLDEAGNAALFSARLLEIANGIIGANGPAVGDDVLLALMKRRAVTWRPKEPSNG